MREERRENIRETVIAGVAARIHELTKKRQQNLIGQALTLDLTVRNRTNESVPDFRSRRSAMTLVRYRPSFSDASTPCGGSNGTQL